MASLQIGLTDATPEEAAEIATAIREAGSLQYTNVEGNTVNVQIGSAEASGLTPRAARDRTIVALWLSAAALLVALAVLVFTVTGD